MAVEKRPILVFSEDSEKLVSYLTERRAENDDKTVRFFARNPRLFRISDMERARKAVLLDDSEHSQTIAEAYADRNSKAVEAEQTEVEMVESYEPLTEEQKQELRGGMPDFTKFTIQELLEYAEAEFGEKVIGAKKADIVNKVQQLWKEAQAGEGNAAPKEVDLEE